MAPLKCLMSDWGLVIYSIHLSEIIRRTAHVQFGAVQKHVNRVDVENARVSFSKFGCKNRFRSSREKSFQNVSKQPPTPPPW